MFDFYHNGNTIGFTVSGMSGGIMLFYIIIEFSFYLITKTFLFHKLLIGLRVRYQVRKMIPKWWYIKKISYLTINKNRVKNRIHDDYGKYEVFIEVMSKVKDSYTNDWIKVNWLGKIKREDLLSNIEFEDSIHQKEIKQWSRNNILEEIGI